jgi:hypothetical protein
MIRELNRFSMVLFVSDCALLSNRFFQKPPKRFFTSTMGARVRTIASSRQSVRPNVRIADYTTSERRTSGKFKRYLRKINIKCGRHVILEKISLILKFYYNGNILSE